MDKDQASNFLKLFFTQIIAQTISLRDFCVANALVHFQNKKLNMFDAESRLKELIKTLEKFHFEIEDLVVIDALIISIVRLFWISKDKKSYHELVLNLVCRMQKNKTNEIWLMLDHEAAITTEVNLKSKSDFMRHTATHQYFYQGKWEKLTPREQECLYYYLNGFSAKEAAKKMEITYRTVEAYIATIKAKYGCTTRTELRGIFS